MIEGYDAVVIGSGAGGSVAFWKLAQAGKRVLMLERGPNLGGLYSSLREHEVVSQGTYNGSGRVYFGNPPIPFIEGSLLGGTTELNGGLFWRTPSFVLDDWRARGFLSRVSANDIEKSFEEIETLLSVGTEDANATGDLDSKLFAKGLSKLGFQTVHASRAVRGCLKSNRCAFGCPTGAKQSMSETLIPLGLSQGGEVENGVTVLGISRVNGGYTVRIKKGDGDRTVSTRTLVLAGGVHESPRLVARVLNKPVMITKHDFHVNVKVIAKHSDSIRSREGTIFTHQLQEFIKDGVLIMPSQSGDAAWAVSKAGLANSVAEEIQDESEKMAIFTLQVAVSRKATQVSSGLGSFVFQGMQEKDLIKIRSYLTLLLGALDQAGFCAYLVSPTFDAFQPYEVATKSVQSLKRVELDLSSVHAMSGLALGGRLVDSEGQLREAEGVFVSDASVLPGHTIESPQGSIMMVAYHVANHILSWLDRSA